jgi:hypothetical protein
MALLAALVVAGHFLLVRVVQGLRGKETQVLDLQQHLVMVAVVLVLRELLGHQFHPLVVQAVLERQIQSAALLFFIVVAAALVWILRVVQTEATEAVEVAVSMPLVQLAQLIQVVVVVVVAQRAQTAVQEALGL